MSGVVNSNQTLTSNKILLKEKSRILIVDDLASDLFLINSIFEYLNCKIDHAKDGKEAIYKLIRNDYELLVLDWNMPLKNGNEVMLHIDKRMKIKNVNFSLPLIIYTSTPDYDLDIPNTDYFNILDIWKKPLDLSSLLSKASYSLLKALEMQRQKEVAWD